MSELLDHECPDCGLWHSPVDGDAETTELAALVDKINELVSVINEMRHIGATDGAFLSELQTMPILQRAMKRAIAETEIPPPIDRMDVPPSPVRK